MKRLISLVLVASVLVFSMAVPSYAAENQWIDVLDFCTPNDSGSNMIYLNSGDTVTFDFPDTEIGYIDFVLQFNTLSSPTCILKNRFSDLNLSVIKVNDYTFRFIGNPTLMYNDGIELVFQGVSSGWVEFLSFKISPLIVNSQDCPVTGFVAYGGGDEVSFYYNNWDDYSGATLYGSSNFDYDDYRAYIDIPSWSKFDYIDLHVYGMELSMLSISSNIGGVNIPYEITYLTGNSAMSDLIVNITLDLTQVDRTSDDVLTVLISGDVPTLDGRIGAFTVLSSLGYVFVSGPDETLNFWYRMRNFFSDKFSSLNTWISSQTTSIVNSLDALGQKIVDAFNPDSDAADSIIDKTQDQANQMDDVNSQMQQLPKPDLSGSGDTSNIVSVADTQKYTVFLARVVQAPFIADVIMISLIMSLAGYVLFGKR